MIEWWVMRVIGPDTMRLTSRQRADLESGALACVNGEVCEPCECYEAQERAIDEAVRRHRRTGQVHKVVMNAEL